MSLINIGIIDLGINNTSSLKRAIAKVESRQRSIDVFSENQFTNLDLIFLPGVGNFGAASKSIDILNLKQSIHQYTKSGKPIVAICLGMQLLFGSSEESPESNGLSFLEGSVKRLPSQPGNPVPNVGWSEVKFRNQSDPILKQSRDFYFTHSFYVKPSNWSTVFCVSKHGNLEFASGVMEKNIIGFQFHPEKSGEAGLALLKWVIGWARGIG